MAKIPGGTLIMFGSLVNPASEVGQFGSYASPDFSGDISVMMSGTAWPRGWFASVLNNQRQFIQDANAVDCVFSNFLGYLLQMGITEYFASTVYDLNSIVQVAGQLYISLVAPNTGNTPATSPTAWQSGIPGMEVTGVIKDFAGLVAPSGFLLCNGQAVSRTTYAALFAVCGVSYGAGDGVTTFNVPDCRGKVRVPYLSGDSNFGQVGNTGGEKTHTLLISEVPPLNVPVPADTGANPTLGSFLPRSGSPQGNVNISTNGGGGPHNNLPPYVVIGGAIIKT